MLIYLYVFRVYVLVNISYICLYMNKEGNVYIFIKSARAS